MRLLPPVLFAIVLAIGPLSARALAEGPPSPSVSPRVPVLPSATVSSTPTASPSPSSTSSRSPSPRASPSPSASPSAAPSASPTAAASPAAPSSAAQTPVPAAARVAPAIDVERLLAASSLAALIDARTRLAQVELDALDTRRVSVEADLVAARADVLAMAALGERRRLLTDRVLRDGLRVASLGGLPPPLLDTVAWGALDEEVRFLSSLYANARRLADDEAELASIIESVGAKHAELARLGARSQRLVGAADAGAAQVGVLRAMADDAAVVSNAIAELMRGASAADVTATWQWPLQGIVSQRFGPSALALEPPVTYRGVSVAHFHDGVDIAAPLGSAVVAPASGRVTFVGHLPDGAMIVVLSHDDGLVSLAAHLDDAFAPPPVRVGTTVRAGQVIGYVGLTGMTTGPHLHFAVHDTSGPMDPLVILAQR